jgi:hypothetical protein
LEALYLACRAQNRRHIVCLTNQSNILFLSHYTLVALFVFAFVSHHLNGRGPVTFVGHFLLNNIFLFCRYRTMAISSLISLQHALLSVVVLLLSMRPCSVVGYGTYEDVDGCKLQQYDGECCYTGAEPFQLPITDCAPGKHCMPCN